MAKKLNVTKHFKERLVERKYDMKYGSVELKQYVTTHDPELYDEANKMYNDAEFLWKGNINDNVTRHFYIYDGQWILVTDTDDSAMITFYKCDLNLPEALNKQTIAGLLKEIIKINRSVSKIEDKEKSKPDRKRLEVSTLSEQIKATEKQLELLNQRKKAVEEDIKTFGNEARVLKEEVKKYVSMIVNSLDYRNDILGLAKAK